VAASRDRRPCTPRSRRPRKGLGAAPCERPLPCRNSAAARAIRWLQASARKVGEPRSRLIRRSVVYEDERELRRRSQTRERACVEARGFVVGRHYECHLAHRASRT
jgi:hypothetical protein